MKIYSDLWTAALLLLYLAGLIAIGVPLSPWLADSLPWLILLVLGTIWLYRPKEGGKLVIYSVLGGCIAFVVEILNKQTGVFFGPITYTYQQQFLISGVPVAVIWVWALALCTAGAAAWIADFGSVVHIFFQAVLMLILLELLHSTGTIWEEAKHGAQMHALIGRFGLSLVLSAAMHRMIGRYDHVLARFAYSFTLLFLLALIFIIR